MNVLDKSLLQKKFDPLGSLRIIREKIIIVCPTPCDADILTRNKTIELAGGTIIVTSNTSDKSTAKKVVVSLGIPTESVVYDAVR